MRCVKPQRNASKLLCLKDKLVQLSLTGTCPLSKVRGEEKWAKVSFSGGSYFLGYLSAESVFIFDSLLMARVPYFPVYGAGLKACLGA